MVPLNNNNNNDSQEKQWPDPRLMLSPIDLSSIRLRRSERARKTMQQMNLTVAVKCTMCHLARWADHQEWVTTLTDSTLNYPCPLALAAQATDTETLHDALAMQQPDREQFILAMIKEIKDFYKRQSLGKRTLWRYWTTKGDTSNMELQMKETPRWHLPKTQSKTVCPQQNADRRGALLGHV